MAVHLVDKHYKQRTCSPFHKCTLFSKRALKATNLSCCTACSAALTVPSCDLVLRCDINNMPEIMFEDNFSYLMYALCMVLLCTVTKAPMSNALVVFANELAVNVFYCM